MHGYADADTISLSIYICMHTEPADSNAGRSEVGVESRVRSCLTLALAEEIRTSERVIFFMILLS